MWAVETQGLAVRFGQYQALEDVSLRVPEGSFVAVVGPNGAGKSTLLKALLGLVPFRGEVRIFGRPLGQADPFWFGYVPQIKTFDRTFPALALELVVSGLRRAWPFRVGEEERRRALEALGRVGALELAHRPLGRLSGGQLQRVYLARALVRRPRLLLLDEPFTGVDPKNVREIQKVIAELRERRGVGVFITDHAVRETLAITDRVYLMYDGQVLFHGDPETFAKDQGVRRHYLGEDYEL
jgi:zinc transport system ATP-binding protein